MKQSFRERMIRFMSGRNGTDTLTTAVLILALVLIFLNWILQSVLLSALSLALMIYADFRVFSKNLLRRRRENAAFCGFLKRIKGFFRLQKNKWRDRKTHIYRICPHCKRTLRLPRDKGEHTVRCPCCQNRFSIKVR